MKTQKSVRLPMFLTLCWWGLIWIVSSLPSKNFPDIEILSIDKVAHAGVYLVLGLLMDMWLQRKRISGYKRALIFALVLISALADEYHQHMIPGRSVSVFDFLANALGLILAYLWGTFRYDKRTRS